MMMNFKEEEGALRILKSGLQGTQPGAQERDSVG